VCESKRELKGLQAGSIPVLLKIRIINDRKTGISGSREMPAPMHCRLIRGVIIREGRIPGIIPHPWIFFPEAH
jgi:hypothetical protein